jgi:tetratricopeptide (TPR) repeat protein
LALSANISEAILHGLRRLPFSGLSILIALFFILAMPSEASSQTKLDSLKTQLDEAQSHDQGPILQALARRYYLIDSIPQAYDFANRSIEACNPEDIETLCNANLILGYVFLFWDDYNSAIEAFLKSLTLAREYGDKKLESVSLHGLSRAYADVGDLELAEATTETGLNIARQLNNKQHIAGLYNNLGTIYTKQKNYPKALEALMEYEQLSRELGDRRSIVYALNNQAEVLIIMEDFQQALTILDQAQTMNDTVQDVQAKAAIIGNMGQIWQKKGNWREAIRYHEQSLALSLEAGIKQFSADTYRSLSESYASLGNYRKALEYFKSGTRMQDSLLNESSQRQLNDLLLRHRMAEEQQAFQILEQKNENQKLWFILLIMAALLGISILVIIIAGYRFKIRLHKAEQRKMTEVIEKQHRELASVLMQNSQVREVLNHIERSIKEYETDDADVPDLYAKHLNTLKHKVRHTIEGLDEWESIKLHFDKVHPDFFKKLQELYSDLTRYDLKQCAYIKMDLGTKDIARILTVSDRAVQTARYRIKKKMKLDAQTDLIQYIQSL